MKQGGFKEELEALHAHSFAWALTCCRYDRQSAADVLQTAYLKVLEGKAHFDGRSSLKTWFFSVVRLTAADRRRRLVARALRLEKWLTGSEPASEPELPADALARSRQRERLIAALRRLPRRQREVLELVFYQGLTIEEASEVMGVALGTARVHYQRGKKKLTGIAGELE